MTHVVYWLFDEFCNNDAIDGYVGVTRHFAERINDHRKERPRNSFDVIVLFRGIEEECYSVEYRLRPRAGIGWNRAPGGPDGYKVEITEATRLKLRKPKTEEHKRASGAGNKGKIRSLETRMKLSLAHKGKPLSPEHTAALKLSKQGFKPSPKANIAARAVLDLLPPPMLGKRHSEETKSKMRATFESRRQNGSLNETKQKLSLAWVKRRRGPGSD